MEAREMNHINTAGKWNAKSLGRLSADKYSIKNI